MKAGLILALFALIIVAGCTTANISADSNAETLEQANAKLREEINKLQSAEVEMSGSMAKLTLKGGIIFANPMDSDTQVQTANDDIEAFDEEIAKLRSQIKVVRQILNDWSFRNPTNETKRFISMYNEMLDDDEKLLAESSEFSDLNKKYAEYKSQDVQLSYLSGNVTKLRDKLDIYFNDIDYHEAINEIDKIILIIDKKIVILENQTKNPDIQIWTTSRLLEEERLMEKFYTEVKIGLDKLIKTPAMSYDFAFEEARKVDGEIKANAVFPDDLKNSYQQWKNENLKPKATVIDNSRIDSNAKYLNIYRYIESNQDSKIVLDKASSPIAKIL